MKIDKIIFACSAPPYVSNDDYCSFWNVQARLWKRMGIEPVCLLMGDQKQTDMTEGTVIEIQPIEGIPWSVQLTWAKFVYPLTDPDKVWMIGDIDMLPLKRSYFIDAISGYSDDTYLHLNCGGIAGPRAGDINGFINLGPQTIARDHGKHGADLPAHYHVAKGFQFAIYAPFKEKVHRIFESHRYGLGPDGRQERPKDGESPYWYYWCAEEQLSSEILWQEIQAGHVKYRGIHYSNANNEQRICRGNWDNQRNDYTYSPERIGEFVDVHCVRPYGKMKPAFERIMSLKGIG